jgi:protein-S-isoprenylcysteine O-methyltransferase Ste14
MNVALPRWVAYRGPARKALTLGRSIDVGELASKVAIVTLFSYMATRIAADTAATGHATGILLLVSEALVVVLTIVRRRAASVDRTLKARLLTSVATFGPPLVHPDSFSGVVSDSFTVAVSGMGLIVVVIGKLSLGRSFGLVPANRGVVSTGVYRFVRHPIYLGYMITHVGFLLANPGIWNVVVLATADIALMLRARCEEHTLAADEAYRTYMSRVRWRVLPGVF